MSDVSAVSNSIFSDLSLGKKQEEQAKSNELGQNAFLELMITQLENQSPLDPQDNTQFISQLAQFSSVESLDKLNKNFDSFTNNFVANQALQASTLVGRAVTVPAEQTRLDLGGVVSISSDIPSSSGEVSMNIYNAGGALVDQVALGAQPAGEMIMRWNGRDLELNGEMHDWQSSNPEGQPPGVYKFEVTARIEGEATEMDTALSANVNSVTVGPNGSLLLNLAGAGSVSLADVKQFNE